MIIDITNILLVGVIVFQAYLSYKERNETKIIEKAENIDEIKYFKEKPIDYKKTQDNIKQNPKREEITEFDVYDMDLDEARENGIDFTKIIK